MACFSAFIWPLAAPERSVGDDHRRVVLKTAARLPLTVVDGCGAWQTFVGGGAAAFQAHVITVVLHALLAAQSRTFASTMTIS
jgi:hypothetical protein